MIPFRATYRLQLNMDFTFTHAKAVVPHLAELGISHAYLSPILMARPGSTHGYDTVDHSRISPELGTLDDFRALVAALRERQMGVLLDFVPNHMGIGGASNELWLDVLKHGQSSRYAEWFDIDWAPRRTALKGKVLMPFLGKSYAACLTDGDLKLRHDGDGFAVWAHGEHKLPIRPESEAELLQHHGSPQAAIATLSGAGGRSALDALIANQHWRAAHYATAGDEVNYRRFFNNADLAGIRIDQPDVFTHAHQVILPLVEEGLIDGLRIDHIDGLLDPKGYLETLRAKAPELDYLLVEKILGPHERLRADWPVDGTTGYEAGALLTRVLIWPEAEPALTQTYEDFAGATLAPDAESRRSRLRVMDNELSAELAALSGVLADVAWSKPETIDLTEPGLRRAIREVIAQLAVYRTYVDADGVPGRDRREIRRAITRARRERPHYGAAGFDFIEKLLTGRLGTQYDPALVARTVGRFQQYSGPVMAKGLEDTALYRYNRLVALNEVGAHPERFAIGVDAFHDANRRRLAETPLAMIATSTHDTKRGEDTRALIAAIVDHPQHWREASAAWRQVLADETIAAIHPNDLYLFFQLLLGGWPIVGSADDLADRLGAAMVKSAREARQRSDWNFNNEAYEERLNEFTHEVLGCEPFLNRFLADRQVFVETGKRKGLIQAVLKLTIPGIPDIYRGAEDWEQSYVDPDNRRELDFGLLAQRLADHDFAEREKLVATQALLELRKAEPDLFIRGSYQAVVTGENQLAFTRSSGSATLMVLADLSPGHRAVLSLPEGDWEQVFGGAAGPISVQIQR